MIPNDYTIVGIIWYNIRNKYILLVLSTDKGKFSEN